MEFERNYWLLTIQRNKSTKTIAYEGNLVYYIIKESTSVQNVIGDHHIVVT